MTFWIIVGVLCLLAVLFGQLANTSLSGQYPTYMQQVFAVDPSLSSLTLSVSSVVTLIVLGLVGRWMAKSGPVPIWLTSMLMYMVTGAALIGLSSLFDAVWAFLAILATVGTVGTIFLRALERRRELALLRTLGTTRRQFRAYFTAQGLAVGAQHASHDPSAGLEHGAQLEARLVELGRAHGNRVAEDIRRLERMLEDAESEPGDEAS